MLQPQQKKNSTTYNELLSQKFIILNLFCKRMLTMQWL